MLRCKPKIESVCRTYVCRTVIKTDFNKDRNAWSMVKIKTRKKKSRSHIHRSCRCIFLSWMQRNFTGHEESTGISFHSQLIQYRVWYQSQQRLHSDGIFNEFDVWSVPTSVHVSPRANEAWDGDLMWGEPEICSWDHQSLLGPAVTACRKEAWRGGHNDQTPRWLDILHALRRVRWCTASYGPGDPITKPCCMG